MFGLITSGLTYNEQIQGSASLRYNMKFRTQISLRIIHRRWFYFRWNLQFLKGNWRQVCVNSMGCLCEYSEHFHKFLGICFKLNQVLYKNAGVLRNKKIFINLTQWNMAGDTEHPFKLLCLVRSLSTSFLLCSVKITYQITLKH